MKLNLRKLQHLAGLSLQNGIRLHFESIILFEQKAFGTSLFLSVIAMEEMGKAFWLDHFVFHSRTDGRTSVEFEKEWLQMVFSDHKRKQLVFIRHLFPSVSKKFREFVNARQLDILKQDSIYVGLAKTKSGESRTKGAIINPIKVKRQRASKQLVMVHNALIQELEDIQAGIISHDLAVFRKALNVELLNRLKEKEVVLR